MRLNSAEDEYYNFDDCIEIGRKAENLVLKNFKKIFKDIIWRLVESKLVIYDENDENSKFKQRNGIDGELSLAIFDVKSLNHIYKPETRILLETVSVFDHNKYPNYTKDGWLLTHNSIIVLAYWDDYEETCFYKAFLLFPQIIRPWYNEHKDKYHEFNPKKPTNDNNGNTWRTKFILVPHCDLPPNSFLKITSDIFTENERDQLSEFFVSFPRRKPRKSNLSCKNGKLCFED